MHSADPRTSEKYKIFNANIFIKFCLREICIMDPELYRIQCRIELLCFFFYSENLPLWKSSHSCRGSSHADAEQVSVVVV